jgi:hypothetical protein
VKHQHRRAAGALLGLAWVFWLHRWTPAMLVVTFVIWAILHQRLEAGLGDGLLRRWRGAWRGPVLLIALLAASTLVFVLGDAPVTAKIVPVGLDVLALSMMFFGTWWTLVALPGWLGGAGPPVFLPDVVR